MSTTVETFQLSQAAAEFYESSFVPRIFSLWAQDLIDLAGVEPGQNVLDVACGTGAVTRAVANRLGGRGQVVGLDLNPGMLAVARRVRPDIEWQEGNSADLPFEAGRFDRVLCQAALMFFPDPGQALREMARVVKASGVVAVQVWSSLESQAAYGPFVRVAARHAGPEAIDLLSSYWRLGDLGRFKTLVDDAGLETSTVRTIVHPVRFDSIDDVVKTEVESTPLGKRITADVYQRILEDSREALQSFCLPTGEAEIPLEGHIIVASPRR